jgi:hypothetical protein
MLDSFEVKDWRGIIGEEEETVQAMQAAQQQQMAMQQAEAAAKGGAAGPQAPQEGGPEGADGEQPITAEEVEAEMERMQAEGAMA